MVELAFDTKRGTVCPVFFASEISLIQSAALFGLN